MYINIHPICKTYYICIYKYMSCLCVVCLCTHKHTQEFDTGSDAAANACIP